MTCGELRAGRTPSNPFWGKPADIANTSRHRIIFYAKNAPRLAQHMQELITQYLRSGFYIPYEWWRYAAAAVLEYEARHLRLPQCHRTS